jgi:D-mannonate dehydratase
MFWTSAAQFKLGRLSDSQKILDELQAFRPGYPHLGRLKALVIG